MRVQQMSMQRECGARGERNMRGECGSVLDGDWGCRGADITDGEAFREYLHTCVDIQNCDCRMEGKSACYAIVYADGKIELFE